MSGPPLRPPRRPRARQLRRLLACVLALLGPASASLAQPADAAADEYRLKAAFLLNFVTFTTWSESAGNTLDVRVR